MVPPQIVILAPKILFGDQNLWEAMDIVVQPLKEFSKDSIRLVKRCHKRDQKAFRLAIGFVVMGVVGFSVKLFFIPIKTSLLDLNRLETKVQIISKWFPYDYKGEAGVIPETISKLSAAEMRKIGISERKASYLHDLASNFVSGVLSDSLIFEMDDESLISSLTAVRGIGVWSVHMFMIFALHRPDVLPVGDLGVRKGIQKLYGLKDLPNPAQMEVLSNGWRPYRSIGSWYMWRVIGTKGPIFSSE